MSRTALICGLLFLALWARAPHAQGADAPARSTLAFELNRAFDAWLHGDTEQAAARLDALVSDDRLSGELPRWVAAMRAALAADRGDLETARRVLAAGLGEAKDARAFIRAARMYLALGHADEALAVIEGGLARGPQSSALRRAHGALLWIAGRHDQALESYFALIADDKRESYPYVPPSTTGWGGVRPFGGPEKPPDDVVITEMDDWGEPRRVTEWSPEPYVDLVESGVWYTTDVPGLDRCVNEMAANTDLLAGRRAALPALHAAALTAQARYESFRGDDAEVRNTLRREAVISRWRALAAARVCAQADLDAGLHADAEQSLRLALELARDDIAVLDLQARVLAAQGKAEEARTGPLAQLSGAGLVVYGGALYARGPQREMADRVFEGAWRLGKVNVAAGRAQLEAVRNQFGPEHLKRVISPDVPGVWLLLRGDKEGATNYLSDAGRLIGYESGKALSGDGVIVEHALLQLGVPAGRAAVLEVPDEEDGDEGADEGAEKPPANPDEPEPEPARGDAELLRVAPRAGLLVASVSDTRALVYRLTGVDFWGGTTGAMLHSRAAGVLPDGEAQVQRVLFDYPQVLADGLTAAQIDAALAPDHPGSVALAEALKSLAENLNQARGGSNWRLMQMLRERVGFVFGLVETRAMLLRARLRQSPPRDLAELEAWLKARQKDIDLTLAFRSQPSDAATRLAEQRRAAGIPEVFHAGLLLDAARALARAGDTLGAARLLWFNRDLAIGIETRQRRLMLASVLARKGGDAALAAQCMLAAHDQGDRTGREQADYELMVLELKSLDADLAEFGAPGDMTAYFDMHLAALADSQMLARAMRQAPELRGTSPAAGLRGTLRDHLDAVFRGGITGANAMVLERSWLRLVSSPEAHPACRRLALWMIACDLSPGGLAHTAGLTGASDALRALGMFAQLAEARAASDPAAAAEVARLRALIQRTGTPRDAVMDFGEWWD